MVYSMNNNLKFRMPTKLNIMKYFIDTGKLTNSVNKLRIYLEDYEKIIFDLDDTIFPLFYYDKIVFEQLANLLKKNLI